MVEVEAWARVNVVEVEAEVEWMDDLLEESPKRLVKQWFVAESILPLHRHWEEVLSMDYTLVLILCYF